MAPGQRASADDATAVLLAQGYAGHGSRLATEAKGALSACENGEVRVVASFVFRDIPLAGPLIWLAYVLYRCGIHVKQNVGKLLWPVLAKKHPFMGLGKGAFTLRHAFYGAFLHFPTKGRGPRDESYQVPVA